MAARKQKPRNIHSQDWGMTNGEVTLLVSLLRPSTMSIDRGPMTAPLASSQNVP
jgi:hypothetical protein